MTPAEILSAARALIANPGTWVKGADGLAAPTDDPTLDALDASDPRATCWCAGGAIERVVDFGSGGIGPMALAMGALCAAADRGYGLYRYPHEFNDLPMTTHADVLATFDRAIAALA